MSAKGQHIDDDTLTLYAWDELPESSRNRVVEHLRTCGFCRERLHYLRRAREGLVLLAKERVEIPEMDLTKAEQKKRHFLRRAWPAWPVAAALLLATWFLFRIAPRRVAQNASTRSVPEFAVLHAELAGREARVFVFTPNDSVTTIWLE